MAYEEEEIRQADRIMYDLLQYKEIRESDRREEYRQYLESEAVQRLVMDAADAFACRVQRFDNVIYLIPNEDNLFLGYQKADIKREFLKAGATDRDYYLAQFAILVLLVDFYDGQGSSAKTRDYLRFGDWQNHIAEELHKGAQSYQERSAAPDSGDGLDYPDMERAYEALRSEEGSRKKTTKEGFLSSILLFLQKQGLIDYVEQDEMITTTKKLDSFMDWDLLNQNNYDHMMELLGARVIMRNS